MDRKPLVALAQCFTSYEFASSSTRRPVTHNLITIRGLYLKVQYCCYEILHNTQNEVANRFLHFICGLIRIVQVPFQERHVFLQSMLLQLSQGPQATHCSFGFVMLRVILGFLLGVNEICAVL
jgi:hypothetical protein